MNDARTFPPFHPFPALRLMASLAGTLWTVGAVARTATPRACAHVWARRTLRLLGVEARLASPLPSGGQVWASNHLSWLDPLIYLSLRPSMALAKAEVAAYPLIGRGARRIGLRFVDRGDLFSRAAALRAMVRDLLAGEDFLLFPEGTTTVGDHLAPLYEGGLRMVHRMGVTLLPLRIDCADGHYSWIGEDSLLPHLQQVARSRGTRVVIHPGPVLDPADWDDEEAWLRAIRAHLGPGRPPAVARR